MNDNDHAVEVEIDTHTLTVTWDDGRQWSIDLPELEAMIAEVKSEPND